MAKIYNLSTHFVNNPEDTMGYDTEIEAESIEEAVEQVKALEDFKLFEYFVLESEDGEEYYNSSEV